MAKQTDTTSTFRIVALLAAALMLAAAALVYLQSQGSGGGSSAELAALSQAMPARTADAIAGRNGAFDTLEANVSRLAELRRGSNVPGAPSDWQQLESRASAVLSRRSALEALGQIAASTSAILELSNELLARSGSTAVVREFQQRTQAVANAATDLHSDTDAARTLARMSQHAAYLRRVVRRCSNHSMPGWGISKPESKR